MVLFWYSQYSYNFCLAFVQVDCLAATALQLLLKLKRHLKIMYALSDAQCQVPFPFHHLLFISEMLSFEVGMISRGIRFNEFVLLNRLSLQLNL